MEIPKPPLNEITEDVYRLTTEKYVDINQYGDYGEQIIKSNLEDFRENRRSLYEEARFVALWLYGEIRIDQVFTEEFLQKLIAENEVEIKRLQVSNNQSYGLDQKLREQRALKAKEFVLDLAAEGFWQKAKKEFARNRRPGQSLEDAGKEYMRAKLAFKQKAAMDLQPDEETEKTNHPYEEGNNF